MSKHSGPLSGAHDFLKASYISRWGIVCVSKDQSIAEHMWRVWALVRQWGPTLGMDAGEQRIAEEHALTHDLAEIRTGDCPTPFKSAEVKKALEELDESIYPSVLVDKTSKAGAFFKFCDTAESIFFLHIYGLGKHAFDVRELLGRQMWERLERSSLSDDEQTTLRGLFLETLSNI